MKDQEIEARAVLKRHLERLWDDEEDFTMNYLWGDDTIGLMAEAAANVLLATVGMREYLRREKVKP